MTPSFKRLIRLRRWQRRTHSERTRVLERLVRWSDLAIALGGLAFVLVIVYRLGFYSFYEGDPTVQRLQRTVLTTLLVLMSGRWLLTLRLFGTQGHLLHLGMIVLLGIVYFTQLGVALRADESNVTAYLLSRFLIYFSALLLLLVEVSRLVILLYARTISPALLFLVSFVLLILVGTGLLLLPRATVGGIRFIDALFTATSAVCVTGLTVVDTAQQFTRLGQTFILILIQLGGLGVMTFTGLVGYLFAGRTSFRNQFVLRDVLNSNQLTDALTFVKRVVFVTLAFEVSGAVLIYASLDGVTFVREFDRLYFALFHAISAFCNAGFSTYSQGLYTPAIRFNYALHLIIVVLIFLGGIGFPIVFNIYNYLRVKARNLLRWLLRQPGHEYIPRLINLNSRLSLVTYFSLLLGGWVVYFLFEYPATLRSHPTWTGKIVTALFGSITPRTAGFNTVDLTQFTLPTVLAYLLLMWIGASPGGTGGGIKTSTIAVALLNAFAVGRGKRRPEVYGSSIAETSVSRAFAIIVLSLLVLGVATFLVGASDADQPLIWIAFEVFSAFSTVGLTLGLTPLLSDASKLILTLTMLIGRVGTLTLLSAFLVAPLYSAYQYPKEEIDF
jgi:trk system potassium uptake protein TrkH